MANALAERSTRHTHAHTRTGRMQQQTTREVGGGGGAGGRRQNQLKVFMPNERWSLLAFLVDDVSQMLRRRKEPTDDGTDGAAMPSPHIGVPLFRRRMQACCGAQWVDISPHPPPLAAAAAAATDPSRVMACVDGHCASLLCFTAVSDIVVTAASHARRGMMHNHGPSGRTRTGAPSPVASDARPCFRYKHRLEPWRGRLWKLRCYSPL